VHPVRGAFRSECSTMPELSRFYGIRVSMRFFDHAPSQFHAQSGSDEVIVAIRTLDVGAIHQFRGSFERLRDPTLFGRVRVDPRWGTVRWTGGHDLDPALLRERLRETQDAQRPT
jgi:hypothetical protein